MIPALFTRMCNGRPEATNRLANASTDDGSRRSIDSTSTPSIPASPATARAAVTRDHDDRRSRVAEGAHRLDPDARVAAGDDGHLAAQVDAVGHLSGGRGGAEPGAEWSLGATISPVYRRISAVRSSNYPAGLI